MLLALTGPMYSGKTSLALELNGRGFYYISFTDLLKKYAVDALATCGIGTTIEDIHRDKSRYRPFLQELGSTIGFNHNPKYIDESLSGWSSGPVVFDNARTREQAEYLKERWGFVLVELTISEGEQLRRAEKAGVTRDDLRSASLHRVEGQLSGWGDIVVNGEDAPELNATRILEGNYQYEYHSKAPEMHP